jgi:hypothetical protein
MDERTQPRADGPLAAGVCSRADVIGPVVFGDDDGLRDADARAPDHRFFTTRPG